MTAAFGELSFTAPRTVYGGEKMIIDITQELFSCNVFPGDPVPQRQRVLSIENGDKCNLTAFSMCAHNGTHIDAPFHFINDGSRVDDIELEAFVGKCSVFKASGMIARDRAEAFLKKAKSGDAAQRLLFGGSAIISAEAAEVFAGGGVKLIGCESQTVGDPDAPAEVHKILLGAGTVILEGAVLKDVSEGVYFLSCAPLKLGGADGAPCRAYLMTI